ncbi:hypothetical protein ABES21_24345 [Peribacillus frigoritolerans]|uniref:hypothetical protein n=1 Tax=Peribacillus frigoritolerans TaxID=450367 RepID=UPI003D2CDEB0
MQGYIKDFRKELDSSIWMMPPLYHRVWQYLKYQANHQDKKIPMKDGTFLTIRVGQHLTSVRTIAHNVGWYEGAVYKEPNPKTISSILAWLEKQSMIKINRGKGNRQYTLISLINWDLYQVKELEGNSEGTVKKQLMDINKNEKNDKELAAVDNVTTPEVSDGVPTTGPKDDPMFAGEISQTSEQAVQSLLNRFIQLRAYGLDFSPKDENAANEIISSGVPLNDSLVYLTECFEQYKPKHIRDRINSLSYCAGFILDRHQKKLESQNFMKRGISDGNKFDRGSIGKTTSKERSITGGQTGWLGRKKA